MNNDEPLIFISYTRADRDRVTEIADRIVARGISVWIDHKRIKGGQNWDFEILRALGLASIIIVFVSNASVNKRGYVQREIKLALKKAEEKLVDDIFLIPVLLDDTVTFPRELEDVQFIRQSDEDFDDQLFDAISHQLERIGHSTDASQQNSEVKWQSQSYHEFRDGLPGFEVRLKLLRFSSEVYSNSSQIGDVVRGEMMARVMEMRQHTFVPSSEIFNFGQDRYSRTSTLQAEYSTPIIRGRVISIEYAIYRYYARAAHPNAEYRTFNFVLDPLFQISGPEELFASNDRAFGIIQHYVRAALLATGDQEDDSFNLDPDTVNRGTDRWEHFNSFVVSDHGIEFVFDPYQVAAYAFGVQRVLVPYAKIGAYLTREFKSALDLEWQTFDEAMQEPSITV